MLPGITFVYPFLGLCYRIPIHPGLTSCPYSEKPKNPNFCPPMTTGLYLLVYGEKELKISDKNQSNCAGGLFYLSLSFLIG